MNTHHNIFSGMTPQQVQASVQRRASKVMGLRDQVTALLGDMEGDHPRRVAVSLLRQLHVLQETVQGSARLFDDAASYFAHRVERLEARLEDTRDTLQQVNLEQRIHATRQNQQAVLAELNGYEIFRHTLLPELEVRVMKATDPLGSQQGEVQA